MKLADHATVVVVDPCRLYREALVKLLSHEKDLGKVEGVSNIWEALTVVKTNNIRLVICRGKDLGFEPEKSLAVCKNVASGVNYIVLLEDDEIEKAYTLCDSGFCSCVMLSSGASELIRCVRALLRGETYMDRHLDGEIPDVIKMSRYQKRCLDELSKREKEIVYWLSQGYSNGQIAKAMVLSEKTVRNHISRILKKLDLKDRVQVAVLGWKTGLAEKPLKDICCDE